MVRLVGMGPGSPEHMTAEARDRIESADMVVAFGRIAQTARELRQDIIVINMVEEVPDIISEAKDVAILASGDPCFFGILDFLVRRGIVIDEVVPGLSSMQYMMARLKKSWQAAQLISLHGREEGLRIIGSVKTAVVLTDKVHTPDYISKYLSHAGMKGKIYAGFNLSYENELIVEKSIGEEIEEISSLVLVVIEIEMDKG